MSAFGLLLIAAACGGAAFAIRTIQLRRAGVDHAVASRQALVTAAWAAAGAFVGAIAHRLLSP